MTTRGVKYNFEPNECVLCFEPDGTKARVLYEAKVLTQHTSKDKHGNLKAEYTVHFQGWNSSWDRIVPETFIIKKSAESKALMKRLAMVARNVKKNRSRKRKIDILLKQHFKRKMPPDSSDSSTDDSTDEDDPDGDLSGEENDFNDRDERMDTTTEDEADCGSDVSDEDQEHSDGLEKHGPHEVELDLPFELKSKLEDDCYYINRKKKIIALPSEPNVITILEGYVKNFALNILYGTVEKPRLRDHQNCPPEKSIDLCKEVMDGLRIFFDFTLPAILLYNVERPYFHKIEGNFKPVTTIKKELEDADISSPVVTSPRLRSSVQKATPPHASDTSPKLPRLSPKTIKRERMDDFSDDDLPPRRMTRHAYKTEIKSRKPTKLKSAASESTNTPTPDKRPHSSRSESSDSGGDQSRRRESLRSSTRHTNDLNQSSSSIVGCVQKAASLSDRVTPPPPLLIPSVISSKASKGSNSPRHTPTYKSRCSTPTLNDHDKEGMMNGVLEWHLLPEEVYQQTPPSPSLICGGMHLLRLFVRLPNLLGQMSIPDAGLKALIKHLKMFLEYLADNSEELFPESVYVDASDIQCKTPSTKR